MIRFKNQNVFVVGATGFIGLSLVKRLVKEKIKTSVLIRRKSDAKIFNGLNVKCFKGDLLNLESLKKALRGSNTVFNASGALPYHKLDEEGYIRVNVTGVDNLCKACISQKIANLIHISTVGIYGQTAKNVTEESVFNTNDIYAQSKYAGESVVVSYRDRGLNSTIIRPTIAYGPGDTRPVILSLFKLIKSKFFIPIGSGRNYFHTVYIDNLIDAIVLSANKKKVLNEDFNIGDIPCPRASDLWNGIANAMNIKLPKLYIPIFLAYATIGILFSRKINFLTENKKYKIDKAVKFLNYHPKVDLREGIKRTLSWYISKDLI